MEKNHIKMWYDVAKLMETQEKEKKYFSEKFVKCIWYFINITLIPSLIYLLENNEKRYHNII